MVRTVTVGENYVARAKAVGWRVRRNGPGGYWNITTDKGERLQVHQTPSDRNTEKIWEREFRNAGLIDLENRSAAIRHAARAVEVAAAARANEARTRELEQQAQKLHRAAGGTLVTVAQILKPHAVPTTYSRVLITPTMATEILAANTSNRKIKRRYYLERVLKPMREQGWLYTGDPFRFDTDGTLIDGQHRIMGIEEAGITATVDIICGLAPNVFHVIDTGTPRTASDSLFVHGEANLTYMSAVIRLVLQWRTNPDRTDWVNNRRRWSNLQVVQFVSEGNETQAELLRDAMGAAESIRKQIAANKTGAATFIFLAREAMGQDHPTLEAFIELVKYGNTADRSAPGFSLNRAFGDRYRTENAPEQVALWLKAWRMHATDQRIKEGQGLRWRVGEPIPALFVAPRD